MPRVPTESSDRHVTRASNANACPGLPDVPARRVCGAAKEQKAAAEKKADKQEKRDTSVSRIASVEKRKAEEAALDKTPRAIHTTKAAPRQLHRTISYRELPRTVETVDDSNDDMEVDPPSAADNYRPGLTSADENISNTEGSSEEDAPPKKKVKSVKAKEGIRASVKSFLEKEGGEPAKRGHTWDVDHMVPVSR